MVVIRVGNLELGPGVTHLATDYEVATDLQFNNLIINIKGETVNLTTIILDNILDPGIFYYCRTKCLLSTGYTYYSNIHKFQPLDVRRVDFDVDMPSALGVPRILSNSINELHQPTLFTLSAGGFTAVGNGKLESTTWLIEDLDGNVIWERVRDENNTFNIDVYDIILKNNTVYRIRAIFHSTSGDSSQVGTTTIRTGNNKYTNVLTVLNNVIASELTTIKLMHKPEITHIEYEIVNISDGVITTIDNTVNSTGDIFTYNIPIGIIKDSKSYVLKVKTNLDTVWNYIPFTTY